MSEQNIKFRTFHRKLKTQFSTYGSNHKTKLHKQSKQEQNDKFHLSQHQTTQQAKHQLQFISQTHNNDNLNDDSYCLKSSETFGWEIQPQKWLHNVKKPSSMVKLRSSVENKVRQVSNKNTSPYFFKNSRRQRSKTQTSYHINPSDKITHHKNSADINRIIQLTNQKNKQKQLSKLSCFSPVVTVIPQLNQLKQKDNKNKTIIHQGVKCAPSTSYIQISLGNKSRQLKNTTFAKNQYQRNFYYRKANNTVLLHKKFSEEASKRNAQKQAKEKNIQKMNLHTILKKALAKSSHQIVDNIEDVGHVNTPTIKTSPLKQELARLKNLLYGQQYNYLQFGEKSPIKIFGLTSSIQE